VVKKYKYTAINLEKKKFTGVFLAEDEQQLARRLAEQSLYLVKATPVKKDSANVFFSLTGKLTANELATFCRQFAIMITTGVSIVDALSILKGQPYTALLKTTLEFVYEDVKSGALLSQAVEKHKKLFPHMFCSMIRVGELSGALDKIFVTLADYFETDARIKKKTKSAMLYPTMLIAMAIGVFVLMVTFIIPTFMDALSSLEIEMPPLTIALYNFSVAVQENWKTIVLSMFGAGLLFFLILKTPKGRYWFDAFKIKAPVIGKITTDLVTARFARAFGILIDGGMDVIDSMETVQIVLGNKYVEKRFRSAIEDVRQGMSLTVALDSYKLFPPLIIQMIAVGERTGALAEVLMRACPFFDNQAEAALTSITTIIQPVMLLVIGATVGMLFYAIYSPLLQVMEGLGA